MFTEVAAITWLAGTRPASLVVDAEAIALHSIRFIVGDTNRVLAT